MSLHIQTVRAHDIELTEAIQEYIEKRMRKLEKMIDEHDDSASLEIEFGKEVPNQNKGDIFYTDLRLHTAGNYLFARVQKDDLYASIDAAEDEMMRELRKNKKKKETLIRRGGRKLKNIFTRLRTQ